MTLIFCLQIIYQAAVPDSAPATNRRNGAGGETAAAEWGKVI